jgi:hypothetical protein
LAGTGSPYRIARGLLVALTVLLAIGLLGSVWMSIRARASAEDLAAEEAKTIVERSLPLVLSPDDLSEPAGEASALELTERITAVVLDPSEFDEVTIWSPFGQVLYSTDIATIGERPPGEKARIRNVARGGTLTRSEDGTFSVLVPLRLRSDGPVVAAVELGRDAGPLAGAAQPWRFNAIFLAAALTIVGALLWRVSRLAASTTANQSFARGPARGGPSFAASRPIEVPTPGLREEGAARRKAEDRAKAAEERLSVLQEQYRVTLEELHATERRLKEMPSVAADPEIEERALRAEGQIRLLEGQLRATGEERDKLAKQLAERSIARRDPELSSKAEQEATRIRAALEGAQTELSVTRRELDALRTQAGRTAEVQEELDAAHVELLHSREATGAARAELEGSKKELEDARAELRALRTEEQRAAVLEEELRSARAELDSMTASQAAELVEREAEFEERVRHTREEFQEELQQIESSLKAQHAEREAALQAQLAQARAGAQEAGSEVRSVAEAFEGAQTDLEAARAELAARQEQIAKASEELVRSRTEIETLQSELTDAQRELHLVREDLVVAQADVQTELGRGVELAERIELAEQGSRAAHERAAQGEEELERVRVEAAELAQRLRETEERHALEVAEVEARPDLEDVLRVTQERLATQTEKLIEVEDRAHAAERELAEILARAEEFEAENKALRMEKAMRDHVPSEAPAAEVAVTAGTVTPPLEDRRASTPFVKDLSLDAKKTLTRILGMAQLMKHKKEAKDQAQLIKQLTASVRRLDHTVSDLADADKLAHGTIELNVRRTDLEALVQRVVEESGLELEHEIRVESQRVVVGVDPQRAEQLLAGLLRASSDRTGHGKGIVVRLSSHEGGALLSVEDPEPSSDASISPVVERLAEVHGGWAKVETSPSGGSAFRVFLADAPRPSTEVEEGAQVDPVTGEPPIVVSEGGAWNDGSDDQLLVQELHRLSAED